MSQPIGLVLAGGVGRRLGRTKGDLQLDGKPLALRAAEALDPVCRGVVISVRPGASNPAPGYALIEDNPPAGRGPLAGIHAALLASAGADLLVLACDYPRVQSELLRRLAEARSTEYDVVLCRESNGREHPLVAAWSGATRERIRRALELGRSGVLELIAGWNVRRLGADECPGLDLDGSLLNLNTAEELRDWNDGEKR